MNGPRAAPPWVWAAAGALVLVVAMLVLTLDRLWPDLALRGGADLNLARLDSAPAGLPQVVALGDSRLRFAVRYDQQLSHPDDAAVLPLQFVRITRGSANFADLAPALAALCRKPPALLLLQADLLIWQRDRGHGVTSAALLRWHANTDLLRAARGYQEPSVTADNLGQPTPWKMRQPGGADPEARAARYREEVSHWRPVRPFDERRWEASLDCLQRQQASVVLLPMPRAPFAQALLPPETARFEQQRLQQFAAHAGWSVWWPPAGFSDADFHDSAHMKPSGERRYSDWLREQLRAHLTDGVSARGNAVPESAAAAVLR